MGKFGITLPILLTLSLLIGLESTSVLAATFTVQGTLIPDDAPGESTNATTMSKLAEAPVKVTMQQQNEEHEIEEVVLASGRMSAGSITLVGEIDKPTKVSILVDTGPDTTLGLDAIAAPGSRISFALLEWPTIMSFLGTIHSAPSSSKAFRIFGDLSNVQTDLDNATIVAQYAERDTLGERLYTTWQVLLHNDQFEIIGEVTEPRVVNVMIYKGVTFAQTRAIIEPGAEIEIETQTPLLRDVYAVSRSKTSDRHALLIDSWQQSADYHAAKERYAMALENYQKALRRGDAPVPRIATNPPDTAPPTTIAEPAAPASAADDGNIDECSKYAPIVAITEQAPAPPVAEAPEHIKRMQELSQIREDAIETIATQTEEPINSLLALELGAYWGQQQRQEVYDRLTRELDHDTVRRRITHESNDHARFVSPPSDGSLRTGTKAPEFALANLEGTETRLYDIVVDHDFVLLEFWASWCGPCIRIIPQLKDIYSTHRGNDFEIVSISIDDLYNHWAEASEQHELPWINLAELQRDSTEVAQRYDVRYIPKNFLLDHNGCIIRENVTIAQLQEILDTEQPNDQSNDAQAEQ